MLTAQNSLDLKNLGFTVVPALSSGEVAEALAKFDDFRNAYPICWENCPHGIVKHYQAGQSAFAWYVRTRPTVVEAFASIWNTQDLLVSFDGCAFLDGTRDLKTGWWLHTDQAPSRSGRLCVQGFVALTGNAQNTFMCVPGSHLWHAEFFQSRGIAHSKNWQKVDKTLDLENRLIRVPTNPGDLVLWDSRLFHQNGGGPERRLVQYVCFLPKAGCSEKLLAKREAYFHTFRTTSHWPYPVSVNGMQPQTYGDQSRLIDYNQLLSSRYWSETVPNFLMENSDKINKLI